MNTTKFVTKQAKTFAIFTRIGLISYLILLIKLNSFFTLTFHMYGIFLKKHFLLFKGGFSKIEGNKGHPASIGFPITKAF